MPRSITTAAIQMDAAPAPTTERLQRAAVLVNEAAAAGAQLIVLPELFNAGYVYDDSNYERAEAAAGPTLSWMRRAAAQHNIYLAGSLLLRDEDEVYNALLLFAPNGRFWRYDKIYPWGWERAYFRNGRDITVADTELGRIGLLICWDVAHPGLWRRYAGQVDLMVITSCPPQVSNPTYQFAGGETLTFADMGPLFSSLQGADRAIFGQMVNEQTAWLGVPTIHTVGCGEVETHLPNARGTVLSMGLLAPGLLRHLPQADAAVMRCALTPGCKVVDANGRILAERTQAEGEGSALASITLPDERPQPTKPQPASRAPRLTTLISDLILPLLTISNYRHGLRRVWGERMAPVEPATRWWTLGMVAGTAVAFLLGRATRR